MSSRLVFVLILVVVLAAAGYWYYRAQQEQPPAPAPPVFNAAYYTVQFWDGRAPSLEEQAAGPMQNPVEMAHTLAGVEQKLNADPAYREAFQKAFGSDRITIGMATQAIASFERTVVSGNSPFDRYLYGGDKKALSPSARRGLEGVRDPKKGNCATCHALGEQHALLTDNKSHNRGGGVIFWKEGEPVMKDLGRYEVTKQEADQ